MLAWLLAALGAGVSPSAARASEAAGEALRSGAAAEAPPTVEDEPELRSRTRIQRPQGPMPPEEGAAEEVDLRGDLDHLQGVEDALQGRRGIQIRRTGAPGEAAFLSIRGTGAQQVRVHLDGVPLHGGAQTAYNLALLPLPLLGSIRIYRTGAPLALGPPLPGGAIDLRSRFESTDGWQVAMEAGSMPSARLTLAGQTGSASRRTLLAISALRSAGRFAYYDDGGTPLYPGDDTPNQRRDNNDLHDLGVLFRHMERLGPWRLTGVTLAQFREHGIPGLGTLRAEETRLSTHNVRGQVLAERPGLADSRVDVALVGAGGTTTTLFRDPALEVSLDRERFRQTTGDALARALVTGWFLPAVHVPASADVHLESRRADDHGAGGGSERGQRVQLGTSLEPELRLLDERVRVRVGGRWDHLRSMGRLADADAQAASLSLPSWHGRIAFQESVGDRVHVQGYAGIAGTRRPPSLDELFGDGGWRVGSPDLRPEERTTASAGLTALHPLRRASVRWSWDVWAGEAHDLIVWVHNAQGVARSMNIGSARFLGHEFELAVDNVGPLATRAYLTLTDALQRSDDPALHRRRLPGEAPERGGVESWWRWGAWKLQHEWAVASSFFADEYNRRPLPARREHHLAVRWSDGPWSASLSVRNLTDARTRSVLWQDGGETVRVRQPVSDTLGYPLPGRLVFAQLRFGGAWRTSEESP